MDSSREHLSDDDAYRTHGSKTKSGIHMATMTSSDATDNNRPANNGLSNDVSVVDLTTGAVVKTFRVGERPWGIALVY
jgi:YVTN family beta-propeller protein